MKESGVAKQSTAGMLSWQSLVSMVVFAVALVVFIMITQSIFSHRDKSFDDTAFQFFESIATPVVTAVFLRLTFFGSITFLLPAYTLLVLYFLFKVKQRRAIRIAMIATGSGVLLVVAKRIFRRPRPLHPLTSNFQGFSYPSGHSFSSFIFAGVLIYILWRSHLPLGWKWFGSVVFFLFAFSVALSRVYLHVHYASDVLAGFFLSLVWLSGSIYPIQRLTERTL